MAESYFVARDEKQIGPFTAKELLRAIREGRYQPDDLLWQDSVGDWLPLGDVSPFKQQFGTPDPVDAEPVVQPAPPPAQPKKTQTSPPVTQLPPTAPAAKGGELIRPGDSGSMVTQRRPFVRYAARMIDLGLFFFIVIPLARELGLPFSNQGMFMLELLALALFVPVEALVLARFGTTPGKAFLRARVVRDDGQRLDLGTAISRSTKVWLMGWGLGLPLISLVTLILSFVRLTGEGKTAWDAQCNTRVLHEPVGFGRGFLAIVLIFFLMGSSVGGLVEQAARFGS